MTHACYLLRSLNPRFRKGCYIGCTTDPRRRLRQHNGEIGQGAGLTKAKRPWEMVLCVYGFPSHVEALKFEWAWQHPLESLAVREAAAKLSCLKGIPAMIALACTMVTLSRWSSLNLTLQFMLSNLLQYRHGSPPLPPQMRLFVAPMSALPGRNSEDENDECDNVNSFPGFLSQKDLDDDYNGAISNSCGIPGVLRQSEGEGNPAICAGDCEKSSPLPPKVGKKSRKGKTPKGRNGKRGGGPHKRPEGPFVVDIPEMGSGIRLTFEGDEFSDWNELTLHCSSPATVTVHATTHPSKDRKDRFGMDFDLAHLSLDKKFSPCPFGRNGSDVCSGDEDRLNSLSIKSSICTSIDNQDRTVDEACCGDVPANRLPSGFIDKSNLPSYEFSEGGKIHSVHPAKSITMRKNVIFAAGQNGEEGVIDLCFDSGDVFRDSVTESLSSPATTGNRQSDCLDATDLNGLFGLTSEVGSRKLQCATGGDYEQQELLHDSTLIIQDKLSANRFGGVCTGSLHGICKELSMNPNRDDKKTTGSCDSGRKSISVSVCNHYEEDTDNTTNSKEVTRSFSSVPDPTFVKQMRTSRDLDVGDRDCASPHSYDGGSKVENADRCVVLDLSPEPICEKIILNRDAGELSRGLKVSLSSVTTENLSELNSARRRDPDLSNHPSNHLSNHQIAGSDDSDDSDVEEITLAQFQPVERRRMMKATSCRRQNFEGHRGCNNNTLSLHSADVPNDACPDSSSNSVLNHSLPVEKRATTISNSLPSETSFEEVRSVFRDHTHNPDVSTEVWTGAEGVGLMQDSLKVLKVGELPGIGLLDDDDEIQEISVKQFEQSRPSLGSRAAQKSGRTVNRTEFR